MFDLYFQDKCIQMHLFLNNVLTVNAFYIKVLVQLWSVVKTCIFFKYLIHKFVPNCCMDLKFGDLIVMMILKGYIFIHVNVFCVKKMPLRPLLLLSVN